MRNRATAGWWPFWVFPLLIVMAITTVWLRLSIVRTTYEIGQTEKQIQNARQDVEKLELHVARLRSPRNLEALARARYQLDPPAPNQIVRLGVKR